MKRFNTEYEAQEHFHQFTPYTGEIEKNHDTHLEFGDWILLRRILYDYDTKTYSISRPILGLFVGYSVIDMALAINYVEKPRAWMSHCMIGVQYGIMYRDLMLNVTEYETWHNSWALIARWDRKPTISELKSALINKQIQ